MVPILNHSLFININNKITKVIVEIVIEIELFITILLFLDVTDLIKLFPEIPSYFADENNLAV